MSRPTWQLRGVRGAALALMAIAALAAPAAAADTPPGARDTRANACPDPGTPDAGFTDTGGNIFEHEIDCLAWYEVTSGGPGGLPTNQYGPSMSVTRAQMATFIVRYIDHVDPTLLPAYDGTNDFTDVPANNVHLQAINRLAAAEVVQGGAGGRPANQYAPNDPVRRDQMASFIARATGVILEADFCVNVANYFDDDNGSTHEACINALADLGVVAGTGAPGVYSPANSVTRAQMSAFIMRSMDVLVEQTVTSPPAADD